MTRLKKQKTNSGIFQSLKQLVAEDGSKIAEKDVFSKWSEKAAMEIPLTLNILTVLLTATHKDLVNFAQTSGKNELCSLLQQLVVDSSELISKMARLVLCRLPWKFLDEAGISQFFKTQLDFIQENLKDSEIMSTVYLIQKSRRRLNLLNDLIRFSSSLSAEVSVSVTDDFFPVENVTPNKLLQASELMQLGSCDLIRIPVLATNLMSRLTPQMTEAQVSSVSDLFHEAMEFCSLCLDRFSWSSFNPEDIHYLLRELADSDSPASLCFVEPLSLFLSEAATQSPAILAHLQTHQTATDFLLGVLRDLRRPLSTHSLETNPRPRLPGCPKDMMIIERTFRAFCGLSQSWMVMDPDQAAFLQAKVERSLVSFLAREIQALRSGVSLELRVTGDMVTNLVDILTNSRISISECLQASFVILTQMSSCRHFVGEEKEIRRTVRREAERCLEKSLGGSSLRRTSAFQNDMFLDKYSEILGDVGVENVVEEKEFLSELPTGVVEGEVVPDVGVVQQEEEKEEEVVSINDDGEKCIGEEDCIFVEIEEPTSDPVETSDSKYGLSSQQIENLREFCPELASRYL